MSAGLIGFVGVIYAVVAYNMIAEKNPGMALVYASYALGNIGFIIAIMRGQAGG